MMFSSYKNRERLCVSIYICEHGCEISENDIDFRPKKKKNSSPFILSMDTLFPI